jgi:membrane fusion protein (multidrug efflux system)
MTNRFEFKGLLAGAVLLACFSLGGCSWKATEAAKKAEKDKNDEKKKERGVPVEVAKIARGPIEEVITASNHLEAEAEVKVYSRTANLVAELLVEEGDRVVKDQVLVRLEDTDQRLAYKKTQSQLAQSAAEFARTERMFQEALVPQKEYDDQKGRLEQLKISLEEAARQLDFTEIKAPIAGTITTRLVKLGDQVNGNQHLFDIVDFDSIVARVYVAESHLAHLKLDQTVRIIAKSLNDKSFTGYVKRIAPVVDKNSGTVKVTLGLRDRGELRPGMYVDAELVIATHPNALLIPKRAIAYGGDQMFVYRLQPGRKVKRVLVTPLLSDRDHVEPVDGFEEGDEIVIAGQTGLRNDALVELPGDPDPNAVLEGDKGEKAGADAAATNAPPPDSSDKAN